MYSLIAPIILWCFASVVLLLSFFDTIIPSPVWWFASATCAVIGAWLVMRKEQRDKGQNQELGKVEATSSKQSDSEPVVSITDSFRGYISPLDLMKSTGTIAFQVRPTDLASQSGVIFNVKSQNWIFGCGSMQGNLLLQRNRDKIVVSPEWNKSARPWTVSIGWSPTELVLGCGASPDTVVEERIMTTYSLAPESLLAFCREQRLLPNSEYSTVEEFRSTVYDALQNLSSSISTIGALNAFWDRTYDGKKLKAIRPKRETDIHPTLKMLWHDWSLQKSIEIVPERETSVGNLDFSFSAQVANEGRTIVAVEVKLAHAQDVVHGLEVQLPQYMERLGARYGALLVCWFRGNEFNDPADATIKRMCDNWGEPIDTDDSPLEQFKTALQTRAMRDPKQLPIRVFVVDLSKPTTASKA